MHLFHAEAGVIPHFKEEKCNLLSDLHFATPLVHINYR
jgi:hypothetical protein